MQFYIDTANIDEIEEMAWIIDGVTTNPTLVSREKRPFTEIIAQICNIVDGPVSAEATALDTSGMIKQARELSKIAENVVVKIPMTSDGMKAVTKLSDEGIRTNVTLVFSVNQALVAAKAGANFVSPFVGRIDDAGGDGMDVVSEILDCFDLYQFSTEVIVASIRHPHHVAQAALLGADIATVPYQVLAKLFNHPLTDVGIKRFLNDWEGVDKT